MKLDHAEWTQEEQEYLRECDTGCLLIAFMAFCVVVSAIALFAWMACQ